MLIVVNAVIIDPTKGPILFLFLLYYIIIFIYFPSNKIKLVTIREIKVN